MCSLPKNSILNPPRIWKWKVSETLERADLAVLKALGRGEGQWEGEPLEVSRSYLKKLMEEGLVRTPKGAVKPGEKLKQDLEVSIEFPAPVPLELVPEDRSLDILYEDEHLVVINKPQGLTVHPSTTQKEGTLVHALLFHIRDLSGVGGVLRPGIVHRIDKDTSGALVITKTDLAHTRLVETFSRHEIDRVYWALCYGAPRVDSEWHRVESLIGRHETDRKRMSMKVKRGKKAITHYRLLEAFRTSSQASAFASWLEVKLETGRTHQVRVHLTHEGYSILGDPVYGTPTERQSKWLNLPAPVREQLATVSGQMLHARVLGFVHPITGVKLSFEAPPPPIFSTLLERLQKYRFHKD